MEGNLGFKLKNRSEKVDQELVLWNRLLTRALVFHGGIESGMRLDDDLRKKPTLTCEIRDKLDASRISRLQTRAQNSKPSQSSKSEAVMKAREKVTVRCGQPQKGGRHSNRLAKRFRDIKSTNFMTVRFCRDTSIVELCTNSSESELDLDSRTLCVAVKTFRHRTR